MKELTYNEKITKVAKALIKEYKSNKDNTTIRIDNQFITRTTPNKTEIIFGCNTKNEIGFGNPDEEGIAKITMDIYWEIKKLLKLPKKVLMFGDTRKRTVFRGWSAHDYWLAKKIVMVTPCKEFGAINKKLVKLGCKEIPFQEWWGGDTSGKRESYWVNDKNYYACDKAKCDEVLAYLKGKKKLSYEIVRNEDFEDRDYGIRHETEWYGHLSMDIKFTDSKGKTATI